MGIYTEHWDQHRKQARKHLVDFLLLFLIGLPLAIGAAYVGDRFALEPQLLWLLGPLIVWLVVFTRLVLRSTGVICPRCGAKYSRGKYLPNCPGCGLPMLQENP
ncbi:MAG TPA: hypothetical protein VGE27_14945 [Gemmatimonas sp.]|uniref:hypothetical protein n=1 Tax=Gemmatimonas sp. TaxID=1962908 RepID=UPI002ED84638